jgi:hypothetical protein
MFNLVHVEVRALANLMRRGGTFHVQLKEQCSDACNIELPALLLLKLQNKTNYFLLYSCRLFLSSSQITRCYTTPWPAAEPQSRTRMACAGWGGGGIAG